MKIDKYDWQARILPSLLAFIPMVWVINNLFFTDLSILETVFFNGISLLLVLVITLSYLVREISKFYQDRIFAKSGMPSIYMLMNYEMYFSKDFFKRYVSKINKSFKYKINKNDQRSWQEAFELVLADVRDSQFILKLNIRYGFLRNLLGSVLISWVILFFATLYLYFWPSNPELLRQALVLLICYSIPILTMKKVIVKNGEYFVAKVVSEFVSSK
ncbi:hypothetical protein [Fulvivirga sp.]|uniref:hypothetical protein n=1 Tax=Fulvivirga sp. TaxID=1931237 RepID=UPI0032EBCBBD